MPTSAGRDDVRRLAAEEEAQLVEVLPRAEYEWAHLTRALHLPLQDLDEARTTVLDPGLPVVVYCNDFQ